MLLRLAYGLLSLPVRARDWLYCKRLHDACIAGTNVQFAPHTKIYNPVGRNAVTIGGQSQCMGELLVIAPDGKIKIGEWCYVGPQSKLWAMEAIDIGSRVFVSHGVQIFDNNSHSLSADERHQRFRELRSAGHHLQPERVTHKAVRIEDDVWIGFNAAILKGVTIGRGAVIGACAAVIHDVPPYAVVVGNPARQVGESRP